MEKHGGNITNFAKDIECKREEVIDLSSNINFVQPKIDIDFNKLNISSYPNYDRLYLAISKRYNISPKEIELFNGATVGIHTLFRELNLNHCTLYAPIYGEYLHSAKTYGYDIKLINRLENINEEIESNSLVIFVNPSTPDGKFYELDKLMKIWIEKRCTILIDESFLDFTPYESAVKYLKSYNKLYILKSMTKFYSSAGMRIGAIFSIATNIKTIKAKEPLWKISEFDAQYLQSALRDESFVENSNRLNQEAKAYLLTILKRSPFVEKVYLSYANFILIKLKKIDAIELQQRANIHKIMIRNCQNFDFLNRFFVRIAIKRCSDMEKLKKVFK